MLRVVFCLLVFVTYQAFAAKPPEPPKLPVEVYIAKETEVYDQVHSVGVIKSYESSYLLAESSGKIAKVFTPKDGLVTAGQLLAEIDNVVQKANYDSALANYNLAKITAERTSKLSKSNLVTTAENDRAQTAFNNAQAVLNQAEKELQKTKIIAPADGVVSFELKLAQEWVNIGERIYHFEQLNPLEIRFSLPRKFHSKIKVGDLVKYTIGDTIHAQGYVTAISDVFTMESESFELRAIVANPDDKIKPGMFASVDVICEMRKAITIPVEAIVQTVQGINVYTVKEGKVQIVQVEKSSLFDGDVIITKGIEVGDEVIISGQMKLYQDMEVTPIDHEQKS